MAAVKYPLLPQKRADAIVAFRQGRPITAQQFLDDVAALATRLPARRHVVNICSDCYEFAVGLAAALSRGQISLLPPNGTPAMLQELATDFADLYCLTDAGVAGGPIPSTPYPDDLADCSAEPHLLEFPAPQPALVLFTSGSTGRPTPHAKSWGALVRSALAAGARLGVAALPNATVIGTVPHHHSYGLESRLFLPQQHGLAIEAARPFYPGDICAALDAAPRPRILVSTPIHLRTLLREVDALPIVDLVISATASLSPQLAVEAEERFGGRLCEIYGCSEAGQLAARSTAHEDEWQCLDGVVLRQDAQGTWASGAPVAAESLLQDVIELRGADRFLLHDRKADLVNIAGKRTSLAYLNHQLNATHGVKDGIFIMPAEQDGEQVTRLMALVVAPGVAAEEILGALRQRIDAAFLPRPLVLVEILAAQHAREAAARGLAAAGGPERVDLTACGIHKSFDFDSDHPTAAGHFPGNPIIPGAVLLDEILRAIAPPTESSLREIVIRSAKFLEPVRPGDAVLIRWEIRGAGETKFECLLLDPERPALIGVVEFGGGQ